MTQDPSPIERDAERIYEAMRWAAERAENGKPPVWVPGGNSLAQDEARRTARALRVTDEGLRSALEEADKLICNRLSGHEDEAARVVVMQIREALSNHQGSAR